jgi:hypothetical protein
MKFQGFRLPEGQIRDMAYIAHETGMSKSQMVRQGLALVINDYFQKEKVKQEQIQEQNRRRATIQGGGSISLPDGW